MVYWFPQGFISSECTFPCVRGTRFSKFFRVHLAVRVLSRLSQVHGLQLSLGFHTPESSLSCISEVHGLLVSSEFHSPLNSHSHVSEVHGLVGFIRVSLTSEFTFLCVRGALFSGFFRVSITSEFTFPCFKVAVYWFHQGFIHQ